MAIAYDSRRNSELFARETACVLCAAGVKVYLYESLRPVPQLSFALRYLHCISGVVITASHNPAQYNGYKVYWEDGGQIPPDHVREVVAYVDKITDFGAIRTMDFEQAELGRHPDHHRQGGRRRVYQARGMLLHEPRASSRAKARR